MSAPFTPRRSARHSTRSASADPERSLADGSRYSQPLSPSAASSSSRTSMEPSDVDVTPQRQTRTSRPSRARSSRLSSRSLAEEAEDEAVSLSSRPISPPPLAAVDETEGGLVNGSSSGPSTPTVKRRKGRTTKTDTIPPEQEPLVEEEALVQSIDEASSSNGDAKASIPASKTAKPTAPSDRNARRLLLRRKLLSFFSSLGPILRPLLILSALCLLALLPSPIAPFSKKTYVDENALQPASANVYWEWKQVGLCDEVSRELMALEHQGTTARVEYISEVLSGFGLHPQVQDYTFDLPDCSAKEDAACLQSISGSNVYTRWSSARSDGREAVVISAPWLSRWDGSNDPDQKSEQESPLRFIQDGRRANIRGTAIVLGLAKYLSSQISWSKDIIFVFSDGHLDGMQAWSSSYFGANQVNLQADPLTCSGAVIWNSVSIDYPSDSFSGLTVLYEGKDGQVPNMDVVNTLVRIVDRTGGVPIRLDGVEETFKANDDIPGGGLGDIGKYLEKNLGWGWRGIAKYRKASQNLFHQIKIQSSSHPTGSHALLQRFHIDAISIYAIPSKGPYGFWHLGRIVEASMRSYSNLIERLHHSQFFYLLNSPERFVQLGVYLPVAILLSVAMTLTGIAEWMKQGRDAKSRQEGLVEYICAVDNSGDAQHSEGDQIDLPLEDPRLLDLQLDLAVSVVRSIGPDSKGARAARLVELLDALDAQGRPVKLATLVLAVCHAVGLVIFSVLASAKLRCAADGVENCKPLRLVTAIALVACPLITTIAASAAQNHRKPPSSLKIFYSSRVARLSLAQLIHAFTLLEAGMIVAVLSVLNFSAALVLGLLLVWPLYLMPVPQTGVEIRDEQTDGDEKEDRLPIILPWQAKVGSTSRLASFIIGSLVLVMLPWNTLWLLRYLGPATSDLLKSQGIRILLPFLDPTVLSEAVDAALWDWQILGTSLLPTLTIAYSPIILQAVVVQWLVVLA